MTYIQNGIVTEMRDGELMPVPLKAGAVVLVGTFALVDDTGFAVASTAAIAATQKVVGAWDGSADNTTGEDGDVLATARRKKQFLFRNSKTDPVTQAQFGEDVFVEDNQTVAKTTGAGLPVAGKCMGFDTQFTDCVWVEI
ncbi:hypothetical protein IC789_15280 [Acinetobacter seifertii]|uniref:DUF2190 family protein n=1 Tax=Acinetobacter seifertii TaxID=1530123 RepID=A0A7H2TVB2_9GAMM|nr:MULTISPECIES: hypothetical protein [Acinetobacter calcoaceticus/baumannii complex]MBD1220591.1 hypothetical protein [Acinetobacter seifertii]MBD1229836.1 hypothetical protein [Acinetobacter seifertii]QNX11397.1 hypothetical protein IC794_14935 [Acinetobacter seifertii]QNX18963.1 hypothetical protein IC792_15050 [Acinetobacter seifertii]QNX25569.1 hypothetical protein IC791_14755 [Acinetobacter seifertii]